MDNDGGGGAVTFSASVFRATRPRVSVTVTFCGNEPSGTFAVPLICPVDAFSAKPAGRAVPFNAQT